MGVSFREDRDKWQGTVVIKGKLTRRLFKTKREAEAFVHVSKLDSMSGIHKSLTIDEAFTSYLKTESSQKTQSSASADARVLMLAIQFLHTECKIFTVDSVKLEHLQLLQVSFASGEFKKPWTTTTVAKACKVVKAVFRKLEMTDEIPKNPCKFWRVPRGQKKARRPMKQSEFAKIYKLAPDWYKPILLALRFTGARGASLSDLKWDDVDFSTHRLTLRSRKGGRDQMKTILIPIFPELGDLLTKVLSARTSESSFVFLDPKGAPVTPGLIARTGFQLIRKAGISGMTIYGLRHALATDLIEAGVSGEITRRLMGHSDESQLKEYTDGLGIKSLESALTLIRGGPQDE